ncbi:MAG TPA: choice-of-anchor Q domain-containing protein [Solirubrobacteraceae bacterium]|nr:choice-of-anchor Q domain-containing protein [Solirubrobacteraceae bacterium]
MIRLVIAVVAGLLVLPDFARGADRIVTKPGDSNDGVCNADCSLREAIAAAGDGDVVVLGTGTYNLTLGQLLLDDEFTIDGTGARSTTIRGDDINRIAHVTGNGVTLTDLTVTRGRAGPTASPDAGAGGAFNVGAAGELRLIGVALKSNTAYLHGGAIANAGNVSFVESTASGNVAGNAEFSGQGGAIYLGASGEAVDLLNSTISGNTAVGGGSQGGGVYASGNYESQHVTIANNTAVQGAGLYHGDASGDVHETLLADNNGPECGGSVGLLNEDHNLSDDVSCGFTALGDKENVDARIGTLADNGGPTDTHALFTGSPALAASRDDTCPATDQRGLIRPQPGPCAMGAFEGSFPFDYHVTANDDDGDGVCTDVPTDCTLRDAVAEAEPGDRVFVPAGTYTLDGALGLIGEQIVGENARTTIIDAGNNNERVLQATAGDSRVSGVTITGGEETIGGGVLVQGAGVSLTLTSVTVSGNFANQGGGVANVNATLDIVRSTITDNDAKEPTVEGEGGGIYSDGPNAETTVTNSTISANRAGSSETGSLGGGVALFDGSFTARNVTFAGNTAGFSDNLTGGEGGSIYIDPPPFTPTVLISNSIIDSFEFAGCSGTFTGDHNIVDDSSCGSSVSNPLLGALAINGGLTDTHAIGATSPAVDKGVGCESTDQRGLPRKRACDIGAYEFQGNLPPSGGQQPPPPPGDKQLPPPVAGKNVNALPKSGTVKIKLPGSDTFVVLTEGQQIPVGTIVDARKGHVTLIAAGGGEAEFYGGIFKVGQTKGAKPLTTLSLTEKLACPKGKASTAAKKKRKRRLWGDGKGRFRTKGKHSAATVVGTKWLVEDRCTSTLTRVVRGKVRVRDFAKKKNVLVKAGKKYVAKP